MRCDNNCIYLFLSLSYWTCGALEAGGACCPWQARWGVELWRLEGPAALAGKVRCGALEVGGACCSGGQGDLWSSGGWRSLLPLADKVRCGALEAGWACCPWRTRWFVELRRLEGPAAPSGQCEVWSSRGWRGLLLWQAREGSVPRICILYTNMKQIYDFYALRYTYCI